LFSQPTATLSYGEIPFGQEEISVPLTVEEINGNSTDNIAAAHFILVYDNENLTFTGANYVNPDFSEDEWIVETDEAETRVRMVWAPGDNNAQEITNGTLLIEITFNYNGEYSELIFGTSTGQETFMYEEDPPGSWNYILYDLTLIDGWVEGDCILIPPQNLSAEVQNDLDVQLNWDELDGFHFLFYSVYRNNELIDTYIEQNNYLDENLDGGTYTYYISGEYCCGESEYSNEETVTIDTPVLPPANLQASVVLTQRIDQRCRLHRNSYYCRRYQ